MSLNVLSLFSGIGAFEKALTNIGVDYNLVGFSEIDKYAIKSYCSLHNVDEKKNLGDVTKIDISKLPKNIDLLTHGSPCTSFSLAGKQNGGDEGSGTPSSLMWYSVKIISEIKPTVVIWENVANVLSQKHAHNFLKYLKTLDKLNYVSQFVVLNAKNFGVAQNRLRIICVSILRNSEKADINFAVLNGIKNDSVKIKDILEDSYEDNYILRREVKSLTPKKDSDIIAIGQSSNNGSQGGKVYSVDGIFPTICAGTHGYALGYIKDNGVYRQLTPLEVFKLMGFSAEDFEKCQKTGNSKTQLYKQAGNSIVVPMLEEVFKLIYKK